MVRTPTQKRPARDRVRRLQVAVSAEERAGIAARAAQVGMSVSAYLRAAGLCQSMIDQGAHQAVRLLAGLHGELGRITTTLEPESLKAELVALRARLAVDLERLG